MSDVPRPLLPRLICLIAGHVDPNDDALFVRGRYTMGAFGHVGVDHGRRCARCLGGLSYTDYPTRRPLPEQTP